MSISWDNVVSYTTRTPYRYAFNECWSSPLTFKMTDMWDKYIRSVPLSSKCMKCKYCVKLANGDVRCKYSIDNGSPKLDTCNYERKKD